MRVELVECLRPVFTLDGLDAFLVQMRVDIEDTTRILGIPVPEPTRPEDVTAQQLRMCASSLRGDARRRSLTVASRPRPRTVLARIASGVIGGKRRQ